MLYSTPADRLHRFALVPGIVCTVIETPLSLIAGNWNLWTAVVAAGSAISGYKIGQRLGIIGASDAYFAKSNCPENLTIGASALFLCIGLGTSSNVFFKHTPAPKPDNSTAAPVDQQPSSKTVPPKPEPAQTPPAATVQPALPSACDRPVDLAEDNPVEKRSWVVTVGDIGEDIVPVRPYAHRNDPIVANQPVELTVRYGDHSNHTVRIANNHKFARDYVACFGNKEAPRL